MLTYAQVGPGQRKELRYTAAWQTFGRQQHKIIVKDSDSGYEQVLFVTMNVRQPRCEAVLLSTGDEHQVCTECLLGMLGVRFKGMVRFRMRLGTFNETNNHS